MGGGLLDVYVLAGLAGEHGGQRVPVVRRHDRDGVNRLVLEHAVQVPRRGRRRTRLLLHESQGRREEPLVGVAQRTHLDVVAVLQGTPVVQVHRALVTDADDGDTDTVVGALDGGVRLRAHAHGADSEARRADQALLDEVSTVAGVHGQESGGKEPVCRGDAPSIEQ